MHLSHRVVVRIRLINLPYDGARTIIITVSFSCSHHRREPQAGQRGSFYFSSATSSLCDLEQGSLSGDSVALAVFARVPGCLTEQCSQNSMCVGIFWGVYNADSWAPPLISYQ